jgi:hypothetical protein
MVESDYTLRLKCVESDYRRLKYMIEEYIELYPQERRECATERRPRKAT